MGYTEKAELTKIQHDIKIMEGKVSEVLIDSDAKFQSWQDNSKDLNELITNKTLYETKGLAKEIVKPIEYKVLPASMSKEIKTRLNRKRATISAGWVMHSSKVRRDSLGLGEEHRWDAD